MKITKNISTLFLATALIFGSTIFASCSDNNDEPKQMISLGSSAPLYYNNTQRLMRVNAIGDWSINITFNTDEEPWCKVSPASGTGTKAIVLDILSDNEGDSPRSARIEITADGSKTILIIEQLDPSQGDADNPPAPSEPTGKSPEKVDKMKGEPKWLELPNIKAPTLGASAVVTHGVKINNQSVRNFTMLYDTVQKVAYWVAYPLSNLYIGGQKRTDEWQYDPKVPFEFQPKLTSGFPQKEGSKNKYDRGHQMPSADRTANFQTNAQTFYFTNMTAQQWQLNQRVWANLEDKVRGWAGSADTLYVVTGAVLGSPILYTKDKGGADVAVPQNYYKALLSRNGNIYKAIGFWFDNKEYASNNVTSTYVKSINELETLTGFTFFSNLAPETQTTVKAQRNPGDWGL